MAGLPWFKVASDFPSHPKTLRLCALLDDHNAGMYVVRLLAYCAIYAPDGRVPLDMMRQAAGWTKQRTRLDLLVSSLAAAGFIVCTPTHAEMHGWDEWNGAHIRKHAKDNERPNHKYRLPRQNPPRGSGGVSSGPRAGDVEGEREKKKQLPPDADAPEPGGEVERLAAELLARSESQGAFLPLVPEKPKKAAKAEKPPDPRHRPMQRALEAAFESVRPGRYGFHKRDPRAIAEILSLSGGDEAEAVRRFKRGLGEQYRGRCDSICDLADKWNALAGDAPAATGKPRRTMADVGEWNDPEKARETL